jgi:hypothetical protein
MCRVLGLHGMMCCVSRAALQTAFGSQSALVRLLLNSKAASLFLVFNFHFINFLSTAARARRLPHHYLGKHLIRYQVFFNRYRLETLAAKIK